MQIWLLYARLFSQLALSGINDEAARQDRLVSAEISAEWNKAFPDAAEEPCPDRSHSSGRRAIQRAEQASQCI